MIETWDNIITIAKIDLTPVHRSFSQTVHVNY